MSTTHNPAPTSPLRHVLRNAWEVNLRCAVILTVLVPLIGAVAAAVVGGGQAAAQIIVMIWAVHLAALTLVGLPLGAALCWALPTHASRTCASAWFALAGAVGGGALMGWFSMPALVGWAALGAITAGGARAWAHTHLRRAATPDPVTGAAPTGPGDLA